MNPICVIAAERALGQKMTKAQEQRIDEAIPKWMRLLAASDRQKWIAMPTSERYVRAATAAAQDEIALAVRQQKQKTAHIVAWAKFNAFVDQQIAEKKDQFRINAVIRWLVPKYDGKDSDTSVFNDMQGEAQNYLGKLQAIMDKLEPKWLGLANQTDAENQFMDALNRLKLGRSTAGLDADMVDGAKQWLDVNNEMRDNWEANSGVRRDLYDWTIPQVWDQHIAVQKGRRAFVDALMDAVDRSRYVHEHGGLFSDKEMRIWLSHAWDEIQSGGANLQVKSDIEGVFVLANRGAKHREIHIKPERRADIQRAWSGRSLAENLMSHIHQQARDLALLKKLGPYAEKLIVHMINDAYKQDATFGSPREKLRNDAVHAAQMFSYLAGVRDQPFKMWIERALNMAKGVSRAAVMGGVPLQAVMLDPQFMHATAMANGIPAAKMWANHLRSYNPLDGSQRRNLQRAGLLASYMHQNVMRMFGEELTTRWPQKLAEFVMRIGGNTAATNLNRGAMITTFLDAIGEHVAKAATLSHLAPDDLAILKGKGVSPRDWLIWKAAQPEDWRGLGQDTVLTPAAIHAIPDSAIKAIDPEADPVMARNDAAAKLMSIVIQQVDAGVITPGPEEMNAMRFGTRPGSPAGMFVSLLTDLKSFPLTVFNRHYTRMLSMPTTAGKIGYAGATIAMGLVAGELYSIVTNLLAGKDPDSLNLMSDEHAARNWMGLVARSGIMPIYGDYLYSNAVHGDTFHVGDLFGPSARIIEDTLNLTVGDTAKMLFSDQPNMGDKWMKDLATYIVHWHPGSNEWWAKYALDRTVHRYLLDTLAPGYLERSVSRAQHNGTQYFAPPTEGLAPSSTPDLERVVR